jgi:hypothetical protein
MTNDRIIFMCSHSFHLEVAKRLMRSGVAIPAIEFTTQHGDRAEYERELPDSQILDAYELLGGEVLPPGIASAVPPSAELLEALAPYEGMVLSLMSRRNDRNLPVVELQATYHRYIAMWQALLAHHRPTAVIIHGTPHQGHDLVLYALCRHLKIRTLIMERTQIDERLYVRRTLRDTIAPTNEEIDGLVHTVKATLHVDADDADACKNYHKHNRRFNDMTETRAALRLPRILGDLLHPRWVKGLFRTIDDSFYGISQTRPLAAFNSWRRTWSRFAIRRALEFYDSQSQKTDYDAPYVYFAVHYQPERTTMPDGGRYADQLLVIKTVAASLPKGWKLVIREHPRQFRENVNWRNFRSLDFYRRLAAVPNVYFASMEEPSRRLIGNCRAVAVITGTSGWEALRAAKPALVFGNAWYLHCPGTVVIDGVDSCRAALNAIESGRFQTDLRRVNAYIRLIQEKYSFRGAFSEKHLAISTISPEENVASYALGIEEALKWSDDSKSISFIDANQRLEAIST